MEKTWNASDYGLRVKVTKELLVETCFEVEKEEHYFIGFQPKIPTDNSCSY